MASGIKRKALSLSDKLDIFKIIYDEGLTEKKKQKDNEYNLYIIL